MQITSNSYETSAWTEVMRQWQGEVKSVLDSLDSTNVEAAGLAEARVDVPAWSRSALAGTVDKAITLLASWGKALRSQRPQAEQT